MTYVYKTKGVCSKEFTLHIEGDTLVKLETIGGCPGNLIGLAALVEGREIRDIINRVEGIKCGARQTSCPDQLAIALKEALNNMKQDCANN